MSYYLIGIGGTGARCMEAFIHMYGAGLLKQTEPVTMLFVDPDLSCGNLKRTKDLLDQYNNVSSMNFGNSGLFPTKIENLGAWPPVPQDKKAENRTLNKVFSRDNMDDKLGYLFDALFTEKERTEDLKVGFKGHPAIGAAILSSTMNPEESHPWIDIVSHLHDGDKIFLFASVFGGTGAAGFPTIAKILKRHSKNKIQIGGTLMLPYFDLPTEDGEEKNQMHAKYEEFSLNTKAALKYYDEKHYLEDVFDSMYLIGDSDRCQTGDKFKLGADLQENDAHIVEMYAALSAVHFFNSNSHSDKGNPYIIGRNDTGNQNYIVWNDLLNFDKGIRDRFKKYIKFLYIYQKRIYQELNKNKSNIGEKRYIFFGTKLDPWYKHLIHEPANHTDCIDLREENIWKYYTDLYEYSDVFFKWFRQIMKTNNSKRKIQFVNDSVLDETVKDTGDHFDYNGDIIDDNDTNEQLNNTTLNNALNSISGKDDSLNGTGIFFDALYNVI